MRILLALGVVVSMAAAAHAGTFQTVAAVAPGDTPVVFASTTDGGGATTLRVGKQTSKLFGGLAMGDVMVGHDRIVTAFVTNDAKPFHVAVYADKKLGKGVAIARPKTAAKGHPFAVAGTRTTDGFTVLFQELDAKDPSTAHTYMQLLDAKGALLGDATEIGVDWGIAAITQTETGYHLAVIYPQGPRLSMVGLNAAGSPQQHPDWASPAGPVSEVHLVHVGSTIHALYRGGAKNDRILDQDVTAIGNWGNEPAAPTDRGALGAGTVLAIDGTDPKAIAR